MTCSGPLSITEASERKKPLTQQENLLVLGDQTGLFLSPQMVTHLNADVSFGHLFSTPKKVTFWVERTK